MADTGGQSRRQNRMANGSDISIIDKVAEELEQKGKPPDEAQVAGGLWKEVNERENGIFLM